MLTGDVHRVEANISLRLLVNSQRRAARSIEQPTKIELMTLDNMRKLRVCGFELIVGANVITVTVRAEG